MCDHASDIKSINESIRNLARAHGESSKALIALASSQAGMEKGMAVVVEKMETINSRGCPKGEDMMRRLYDRMERDTTKVESDIAETRKDIKSDIGKVDKRVDNHRYWIAGITAIASTIAAVFKIKG